MYNQDNWVAFVADVNAAVDGKLDMVVFNHLWAVEDITLYQMDKRNATQLFMYVRRIGERCPECFSGGWLDESQCHKCDAVKYPPILNLPVEIDTNLGNCVRAVHEEHLPRDSGWLPGEKALGLRQVREWLKVNGLTGLFDGFAPFACATRELV